MVRPRERTCMVPMFCCKFSEKRRYRLVLAFVGVCALSVGLFYLNYVCGGSGANHAGCLTPHAVLRTSLPASDDHLASDITQINTEVTAYRTGGVSRHTFPDSELTSEFPFDIDGEDVLVFLHIQKTGGTTFGRHLVRNLRLEEPCKCERSKRKRCDCYNSKKQIWLFSRYSTGWVCGLHADWTELKACVQTALDKRERTHRTRRYRYLTIIRDPLWRYLSEWKHVQRGSTWLAALLKCNGRSATLKEVPFCWSGEDWSGVTLEEFMSCPHNLATNRQTRMLANLSKVGCYSHTYMSESQRNHVLLESAKENLRQLAFFGLLEYQTEMQYLFERTFGLEFINDFVQYNSTHAGRTHLSEDLRQKIIELNKLDVALYQFAKDLFLQRYHRMKDKEGLQARDSSKTSHQGQYIQAKDVHNHLTPAEDE